MDHQAVRGPQVKNGCCNPIPMNENSDFMLSYREPMFSLRPRVCVCVCVGVRVDISNHSAREERVHVAS